jgi:DNA (cytosine-5)-methyltransferase 1
MKYGSLFSGIGGIDLGFDRAGMQCAWQVEIDPYARKVLSKHWPEVPKHDDIQTFKGIDWPGVDVIAGGFPCQDISYAGKGAGLHGDRSRLFFEAMRIVGEMGPKFVVLENVAAVLTRGLGDVLGTLASLGYDAEWHCIPAASVGAPHIRDRVFVLAYINGGRFEECQKLDSQSQIIREIQQRHDTVRFLDDVPNTDSERLEKRQGKNTSRTRAICGTEPSRVEWWSVESTVGRVANGIPRRVDRLRALGNAVVPQVAEFIGRCIMDAASGS